MANRDPRTLETRDTSERKVTWKRANALPDPDPQEGVEFRWIRTSTLGQNDNTNVSSKFREGWEPVKLEDHPELKVLPDVDSKFKGNVEVGGLLLCRNSKENMDARREYHRQQTASQMAAVDNNYMRESDPRMPVLRPEKSTRK
mgnify:FL=1|jgi:hypothetical protein|tara:strand:+ start:598 stop:1029 length:432 start_codon:yes stop_codon:yes gene_type:complete